MHRMSFSVNQFLWLLVVTEELSGSDVICEADNISRL